MKNMKPVSNRRVWSVCILILIVIFSSFLVSHPVAAAGSAEYYIPGGADQLFHILKDIDNDPDLGNAMGGGGTCTAPPCNQLHNVITVIAAQNNAMIYYDHWENGYLSGASGDETYTVNMGGVVTFTSDITVPRVASDVCSSTVSINTAVTPKTTCYDGRDRIYLVGGASMVQAFWPVVTGTVFANAWEIYPTSALDNSYTIPLGENMAAAPFSYLDFDQSFVLVEAIQDGTHIHIDDPTVTGIEVNATLNRGEITQLYHINEDTTVTANFPVYVQFITGRFHPTLSSESRSYTVVPHDVWESSYYSPVPGFTGGYNTDIFVFNPTMANLTINFQDQAGTGSFIMPPHSARDYQSLTGRFVPPNSAVYLEAADHTTRFWALGAVDTESATYNYGFSLIPSGILSNDYYLGWAEGTTDLSANGSPVFVTPTADNTTIFVDFSPLDGVVDATYTLNRIQVQKIFDPDRVNTGMHIWATDRIALVWGEDPNTAAAGNPYIDAGYTVLPTQPLLTTSTPTPTNSNPKPTPTPTPTPTSQAGPFIPVTGFKANEVTDLSPVTSRPIYTNAGLSLEIPMLNIFVPIVGVPQNNSSWDVSWLWDQAGWLEGSAFPTFPGNSIVTAHVVTAAGTPGPFYHLRQLDPNEYIFIHNGGYLYTYKVVSNILVKPYDTRAFAHAEKPTLTLITCNSYDEKTGTYLRRVVVRALLVDVREVK